MANCSGGNLEQTKVKVAKFMAAKAAEDLIASGASFSFPMALYIVNEKDVAKGLAEPELYFDSDDPKKLKNIKVINSAESLSGTCVYKFYRKYADRSEFRKLLSRSQSPAQRREQRAIEVIDKGRQWNAPSGLTLAMSKQDWVRIGENAGWIKSAQQQQPMIPTGQMGSPQAQGVAMQAMETNAEQTKRIQEALNGGSKQMADQLAALQRQLASKQQAYNAGCKQGNESKSPDCMEIQDAINEIQEQMTTIQQKIDKNKSELDQLSKNNLIGGFSLA